MNNPILDSLVANGKKRDTSIRSIEKMGINDLNLTSDINGRTFAKTFRAEFRVTLYMLRDMD